MPTHTPLRVPDHLSPVDIGAYLRDLRVHYALSEQDVSQRLHIRAKYVVAIEQADFNSMPGRAYARGYVHTYAEFLGLDADQVVERCFGAEPARATFAPVVPSRVAPAPSGWIRRAIFVGLAIAIGSYIALRHDDANEPAEALTVAAVEAVPEDYLDGLRTQFMPAPYGYPCLAEETWQGCLRAGRLVRDYLTPIPAWEMAPVIAQPETPSEPSAEPASTEGETL